MHAENPLEFNTSFLPGLRAHQQIKNNDGSLTREEMWIPDGEAIPNGYTLLKTVKEGDLISVVNGLDFKPVAKFIHTDKQTDERVNGVEVKMEIVEGRLQQYIDLIMLDSSES
jgi:hypothetical protein